MRGNEANVTSGCECELSSATAILRLLVSRCERLRPRTVNGASAIVANGSNLSNSVRVRSSRRVSASASPPVARYACHTLDHSSRRTCCFIVKHELRRSMRRISARRYSVAVSSRRPLSSGPRPSASVARRLDHTEASNLASYRSSHNVHAMRDRCEMRAECVAHPRSASACTRAVSAVDVRCA
jgi:hypothetical protein